MIQVIGKKNYLLTISHRYLLSLSIGSFGGFNSWNSHSFLFLGTSWIIMFNTQRKTTFEITWNCTCCHVYCTSNLDNIKYDLLSRRSRYRNSREYVLYLLFLRFCTNRCCHWNYYRYASTSFCVDYESQ